MIDAGTVALMILVGLIFKISKGRRDRGTVALMIIVGFIFNKNSKGDSGIDDSCRIYF